MGYTDSFRLVSEKELDEAMRHVWDRHPHTHIDRDSLRAMQDDLSAQVNKYGAEKYTEMRRNVITSRRIEHRSLYYEAYKSALAKIAGMRRHERKEREKAIAARAADRRIEETREEDQGDVVIADIGPLRPDEVQETIARFDGLGKAGEDEDFAPPPEVLWDPDN